MDTWSLGFVLFPFIKKGLDRHACDNGSALENPSLTQFTQNIRKIDVESGINLHTSRSINGIWSSVYCSVCRAFAMDFKPFWISSTEQTTHIFTLILFITSVFEEYRSLFKIKAPKLLSPAERVKWCTWGLILNDELSGVRGREEERRPQKFKVLSTIPRSRCQPWDFHWPLHSAQVVYCPGCSQEVVRTCFSFDVT